MKLRIALPLVMLTALAVFAPVLAHDFTDYDDTQTIAANPQLHPPTLVSLGQIWTQSAEGLYVPVTYSAWWLIVYVLPTNAPLPAWPFHLFSLLLHATASGWVLLILRRITLQPCAALLGALLFAVHPVQVESVAWASGAKDLLGGCCVFAGLFAWLRYRESPRWIYYCGFLAVLIVGMLAKPSVVVLPLIAAALDRTVVQRTWRQTARGLLLPLLMTVPCLIWSRAVQRSWPELGVPIFQRPLIAVDAISFYVQKILWPVPLTINYGRTPAVVLQETPKHFAICIVIVVVAIALGGLAIAFRPDPNAPRRRAGYWAGVLVFLLAVLPVLGLTPFEFQIHSTVADHYLYVPMLGVSLIAALLVDTLSTRIFAAGLIVILAWLSWIQERTWNNSVTLFEHAIRLTPDSVDLHGALGIALAGKGHAAEAIPHFEFIVQHVPTGPVGHERLAQAYLSVNRYEEAREQAQRAVELSIPPRFDPAWSRFLLGESYAGLGQPDKALEQLRIADQLRPNDPLISARLEALSHSAP